MADTKVITIKVHGVNAEVPAGKKYKMITVTYECGDKFDKKKLTDFSVKGGIDLLLSAKPGDMLDVTTEKNGEYRNWEYFALAGTASAPANSYASAMTSTAPTTASSKVGHTTPRSNYETPEERAARQVMIVRQSSISSAVSLLKTEKTIPDVTAILDVARVFEAFVLDKSFPVSLVEDELKDDIPY